RYYAPWVGRWTSCDPQSLIDGPNVYQYVRGNPIRFHDVSGNWVADMHFAAVYWSGRMAGAPHDTALRVALASQSPDDYESTKAQNMKASGEAWKLSGGPLLRLLFSNPMSNRITVTANNMHALNVTKANSEVVAKEGIKRGNDIIFGLGL